jgi:hypothetical protein
MSKDANVPILKPTPVAAKPPPAQQDQDRLNVDWHLLWFATRRWDWSSLAIVPADRGLSTLPVAKSLTWVGAYHPQPVELVNAVDIPLEQAGKLAARLKSAAPLHNILIAAMDSVFDNQAAIPVMLAADAVLLVVALGQTDFSAARQTLELLGQKTIGCVTLPRGKTL